jgi:hypothetical protein
MLALIIILAVAILPAYARGGGHGSHGGHGHHRHHHHFHAFDGFPSPPLPYGYPCWWEEGHWVSQLYGDKYGNYTYVPEWVPGRWVCWY